MKLFLSSTFSDLREERQAALDVINSLNYGPVAMEHFAAEPATPLKAVLKHLQGSDVVLLILGFKAGSIIPSQPHLTYTAAEFEYAQRKGRKVFAFVKRKQNVLSRLFSLLVSRHDSSGWCNEEKGAKREVLQRFKDKVSSAVLPAYFSTTAELKTALLEALLLWERQGRPGGRKTFTNREEYFAKPARPILLDYDQALRGRSQQLSELNAFAANPDRTVFVLAGRGGIGKTKLLRDWTGQLGGAWQTLFLRDKAVWHPETSKEVPQDATVVIADDAHRQERLDDLLLLVQDSRPKQSLKLVIATRPSGLSRIRQLLSHRFDPSQVAFGTTLQQLEVGEVRELARELLGKDFAIHAEALTAISRDTPLVTVIGAKLLRSGGVSVTLLSNEDQFRRAIFDRLLSDFEAQVPTIGFNYRPLLHLTAALSRFTQRGPTSFQKQVGSWASAQTRFSLL